VTNHVRDIGTRLPRSSADNGGSLQHQSAPSQRPQRAARSRYGFATLVISCLSLPLFLPIGPADDKQGRGTASERAEPARFLVAAYLIAPLTDLITPFSSIVPALSVRLNTQHDLSLSS
jgi:hypothetical protein